MSDTDLATLDATAQAELVRSGTCSPEELVEEAITRIGKLDPELNAVVHTRFEAARAEVRDGPAEGPFRGVPTLLKDIDGTIAGEPNHCGNKLLADSGHCAEVETCLATRLRDAGFVILGSTNAPEFGLLPTTEPLAHGPTRNPWDTTRSPGGSSGGSAAAVASGMVPLAHASDGGGSIRIPASACGLFGLKPSRARVPLGPGPSESWAGFVARHVVTRTVRDSAAVLDELAGPMTGDFYTAPPPLRPFADEVGAEPGRLRIGLRTAAPAALAPVAEECVAAAEEAARALESLGHTVEEASPAALDAGDFLEMFTNIYTGNAAYELDELERRTGREVTEGDVEPLTWLLAEMGRSVSASQYVAAQLALQSVTRDVLAWWDDDGFDLLLTPTLAEPPAKLGLVGAPDEPLEGFARATPYAAFTAIFNVTGQPAASLPLHQSPDGLPIGVQLVAGAWREDVILRVASQLESASPWQDRRPPVHA